MNRVKLTVCLSGIKKKKSVLFCVGIPLLVKFFKTVLECREQMLDSCFVSNGYVKIQFKYPDVKFTVNSTASINDADCNSIKFVYESEIISKFTFGSNDYSLGKDCLILSDKIELQYSDITELINSWCSDPKTLLRINTEE